MSETGIPAYTMNKKAIIFILILSIVIIALSAAVAGGLTIRDFSVNADYAFAYDVENEEFLYLKGEDAKIYPASTTKLLTALFALECVSPDLVLRPGDELELVKENSSVAYIKPMHRLTVEMLIEGMLLPSGNDAAYVIAAGVGRILAGDEELGGKEAVELFMEKMNEYGRTKIGLENTHFTAPDGFAGEEHYTTLKDMAKISVLAVKNEIIARYSGLSADNVVYASGHTNKWKNTNLLLDKNSKYYYEYATGLKTGTTDLAKYCMVASAEKDNQTIVVGIFGAPSSDARFREAKLLLQWSYDRDLVPIFSEKAEMTDAKTGETTDCTDTDTCADSIPFDTASSTGKEKETNIDTYLTTDAETISMAA